MKLTRFASVTIVAVLALWASNAKAIPAFFQFEKLSFSLVAIQEGLGYPHPLDYLFPVPGVSGIDIKTSKITNKELLKFLATAFNTNWPAGAGLALDNDGGDIFVVDKTGTNPVFNVSTGINDGDTNIVYFRRYSNPTVFKVKRVNTTNTLVSTQTDYSIVFFKLFSEQNGITNTDLQFDGLNVDYNHYYSTDRSVTMTEKEAATVAGDGSLNGETTVVKGKVTGSWKRKGVPVG